VTHNKAAKADIERIFLIILGIPAFGSDVIFLDAIHAPNVLIADELEMNGRVTQTRLLLRNRLLRIDAIAEGIGCDGASARRCCL
jgi:hypothetical protein